MPTKINDNFNIQTWKSCGLVLKCIHDLQKKNIQNKNRKKKIQQQNIYESRIKSRIFVE